LVSSSRLDARSKRDGKLHSVKRYGRRFLRPGRHSGAVGVSRPGALTRA
jgi:hypothetical protein